jgi:hypothetical protein
LKQYVVAKLAPGKRTITPSRPNMVIALVAIDPHMVMIHVQVGKKWLRMSYWMEDPV